MNRTLTLKSTQGKPTDFLAHIAQLATPVDRLNAQAQRDPLAAMRAKLISNVADQIELLQSGKPNPRWVKQLPDSTYVLSIRNGNTSMKLGESTFFSVPSSDAVVAFLQAVAEGAKAGELDIQLTETARAKPSKVA